MITRERAGASHDLIAHLDKLAARPGYQVIYSARWMLAKREKAALRLVPEEAWQIAIDSRSARSASAAPMTCLHLTLRLTPPAGVWVEEAHVTELTGLLPAKVPAGTSSRAGRRKCASSPAAERPHPRRPAHLVRGQGQPAV